MEKPSLASACNKSEPRREKESLGPGTIPLKRLEVIEGTGKPILRSAHSHSSLEKNRTDREKSQNQVPGYLEATILSFLTIWDNVKKRKRQVLDLLP